MRVSPPAGSRRPRRRAARRPDHRAPRIASQRPGSASAPRLRRAAARSRLRRADHHRHEQRQREQRARCRSRARVWMASAADQRADHRDARRRRAASTHEQPGQRRPGPGPSSSSANGGHRDELHDDEEGEQRERLGDEAARCGRPARAGSRRSRPARASATNSRLMPSIAANSSVTHRTPAARSPSTVVAVQREVEDDERRDARTAPSPGPTRSVRSSSRSSLRSSAPTGAHQRGTAPPIVGAPSTLARPARSSAGAPAAQAERDVGLGQPAGRVVAGDHARAAATPRPISGSTQLGGGRVEVGERLVEQQQLGVVQHRAATATRWTIPRESVRTGSSARRASPTASSSSSTRVRRRRRAGARGSAGSRAR